MFKSRISRPNRILKKSRVTGPWDHKDSVSAKKVKKKFHACVPLSPSRGSLDALTLHVVALLLFFNPFTLVQ